MCKAAHDGASFPVDALDRLAAALAAARIVELKAQGEPMLHPDVEPFLERLHRAAPSAIRAMTSNGLLLRGARAEAAARHLSVVYLSMGGGNEAAHATLRPGYSLEESAEGAREIMRAGDRRADLWVRSVLVRSLLPHLAELVRYAADLGFRGIHFLPLTAPDEVGSLRSEQIAPPVDAGTLDTARAQLGDVQDLLDAGFVVDIQTLPEISSGLSPERALIKELTPRHAPRAAYCPDPFLSLTVGADLKVHACCMQCHPVGDLHGQSLEEIWTGSALARLQGRLASGKRSTLPEICVDTCMLPITVSTPSKEPATEARVLLLEIVSDDPCRKYGGDIYPHIAGFLRGHGLATEWIVVQRTPEFEGDNYFIVEPPERITEALVEAARAFEPTTIFFNIKIGPQLSEALAEAVQGCATFTIGVDSPRFYHPTIAQVRDWISPRPPAAPGEDEGRPLVGLAVPDYGARVIDTGSSGGVPNVSIRSGSTCLYRRSLASNPYFEALDPEERGGTVGCSFCANHNLVPKMESSEAPEEVVDRALRQIRRYYETAPAERRTHRFEIDDALVFQRISRFAREIAEAGVPPSVFHFARRADEILQKSEDLERALEILAGGGHRAVLWCMGVDNFSPVENERFNKGVSAEQAERALLRLHELETSWPGTLTFFGRGAGFMTIMFTPWTTLDDLDVNVHTLRRLGEMIPPLAKVSAQLGTRLWLYPGTALERLARRDGLTRERFSETFPLPENGLSSWDAYEVPWSFRHPAVATVFRFVIRLVEKRLYEEPSPGPAELRLEASLTDLRSRIRNAGISMLDAFAALLDVVGEQPEVPEDEAVLTGLVDRLRLGDPCPEGSEAPDGQPVEGEDDVAYPGAADKAETSTDPFLHEIAARVAHVVNAAIARRPSAFGGYHLASVKVLSGQDRQGRDEVVLAWTCEASSFEVHIARDDPHAPAFARVGALLVSHPTSSTRLSPEETKLLKALVKVATFVQPELREQDSA